MQLFTGKRKVKFDEEELEWAIDLLEKEFPKEERNTPEKMSALISSNFDVNCEAQQVYKFFNLEEDYELESLKQENYGGDKNRFEAIE